ncbi:cell division cycle 7-related protein kinase-like isoform X2 [Mya arenaria]|nr:cell division cycle 7-related protein kinase-like isoform X2 [Mya arenaria]XP_052790148.1 cell division cycle 7-related protein kinase-like isoform X2 [Mya arenaria]XP_052790149.1 cell division cycle 7-related protein kinase-like isoform X2 [Mya arenaria]
MESVDVDRNSTPSSSKKKAKRLPIDVQEEIDCLYEFVPEVEEHFLVVDKIGEGTFSSVFLAKMRHYPEIEQMFALKHIIPTSHPSRIEGELKCLQEIGGCDNVIGVELCLRNRDHVVIVMQYFPHIKFQDYLMHMSFQDVHNYMYNMLLALRRVHMFDMIHRDVKPSNFLFDRASNRYALVDFGLAHKAPLSKTSSLSNPSTPQADRNKAALSEQQNNSQSSASTTPVSQTSKGTPSASPADPKADQYTPPTPNLSNSVFVKRVKSPRRLLLAKRALMLQEKDDVLSQRKSGVRPYRPAQCQCFGKPQICSLCSSRSNQNAPRAGTPGFRSPEVLMKCPDQSTAVDIWSAGVIFLSLMSGRYPFFRANDDLTALAQIISTFGSEPVKEAAKACGKNLICNPAQKAVDLRTMCMKLRAAPLSKHHTKRGFKIDPATEQSWKNVPDSSFHLLSRLLDLNPYTRITAAEALEHPFFVEMAEREAEGMS